MIRMPILGQSTITRRRLGAPSWSGGFPVAAVATDEPIQGQVVSTGVTEVLIDGDRRQRRIQIVTYSELRSVSATLPADVVIYLGDSYKVVDAQYLPPVAGHAAHWEVEAHEIGPTTPGRT
jgi:hypothetical protein